MPLPKHTLLNHMLFTTHYISPGSPIYVWFYHTLYGAFECSSRYGMNATAARVVGTVLCRWHCVTAQSFYVETQSVQRTVAHHRDRGGCVRDRLPVTVLQTSVMDELVHVGNPQLDSDSELRVWSPDHVRDAHQLPLWSGPTLLVPPPCIITEACSFHF